MSDQGHANEDHSFKYGKNILNVKGKLEVYHSQNELNENDVNNQQKSNNDVGLPNPIIQNKSIT